VCLARNKRFKYCAPIYVTSFAAIYIYVNTAAI